MTPNTIAKNHHLTLAIGTFFLHFVLWATGGVSEANAAPALDAQPRTQARTATPGWRAGMQLSGRERLRFLGFDIYQASLWVMPGFNPDGWAQHGFALELAYLRDFKGNAIARRSLDEMRKLADVDEARAARWEAALTRLLPDVRSGDRITGVNLPGVGARFVVNGQLAGEIADAEFARLFFGIWLSPATSEPALRQALLTRAMP